MIENNNNYREGRYVGINVANRIESTGYKNLEAAILQKQSLIDHFEKEFGFSREQESYDRNYAFNMGILDTFKEIQKKQTESL